jgi:hypothetical protein
MVVAAAAVSQGWLDAQSVPEARFHPRSSAAMLSSSTASVRANLPRNARAGADLAADGCPVDLGSGVGGRRSATWGSRRRLGCTGPEDFESGA